MNANQSITYAQLIDSARELLCEQIRDPEGEANPEYTRGVVNLIAEVRGKPGMDTSTRMGEVAAEIGVTLGKASIEADRLVEHIRAVVAYHWADEFQDARENGLNGHVMEHLIALAAFIGDPIAPEELAELTAESRERTIPE